MNFAPPPSSELIDRVYRLGADVPGRIAYVETSTGRTLTYGLLASRVRSLSAAIAPRIESDTVVMLRCGNSIEYPIWFCALLACGAGVAPVSVELTGSELRQAAARAGAIALVADESTRGVMADVVRDAWPLELALAGTTASEASWPQQPGHLLLASSGTMGVPKVVRRSAPSLDAVSRNMVEAIGFTCDDRVLAAVPLTHSYGVEHGLLAPLWAGSTVHLCAGMDLPTVARTLAEGATVFPAVPSMIDMIATLADASLAMPRLRVAYTAGAALPAAVFEKFRQRFGVRIGQLYGMTEIGSVTFNSPASEPYDPGSVGRAMPGVSIRVLSIDNPRALLAAGEEGEVAVCAPSMFDGYLAGDTPLLDGHFPTGDLGRLDASGRLCITGRVRLLIDAGGMKVNPVEVESVIDSHPGVLECVVLPVRQSETLQRLRVVVVPRDPATLPAGDDIRRFARQRLAGYKVPRVVEFRASLPRTPGGKLLRNVPETP